MTGQHPERPRVATIVVATCPDGHVHVGLADADGCEIAEVVFSVNEALEHAQKVVNAAFTALARGPPPDDAPNEPGDIKH